MDLFNALKTRRTATSKTLANLSELTGITLSQLSNVLNGKKDARASTLVALAGAMDAQWVLVPRQALFDVEKAIAGRRAGPDDVPSAVERLFGTELGG